MKLDEILNQVLDTKGAAFFYTPLSSKNAISYWFINPCKIIISKSPASLNNSVKKFEDKISSDTWGYCFLSYEAGYFYERRMRKYLNHNNKKLFVGFLFDRQDIETLSSKSIEIGNSNRGYKIDSFKLNTTKKKYIADVKEIKKEIAAGNTYQVNYTLEGNSNFTGNIGELFRTLIFNQSAEYTALINTGKKIIISTSPELFFHKKGNKIFAKPMKGTIRRGINLFEDDRQLYELKNSKKDLAENVMIVDLLRNDLGKICRYGKVKVKNLFNVEKYETLFQMTSGIEGKLNDDVNISTILQNIYPCGSITGAPKIRTMEIIRKLENRNRGIYTGTIGILKNNEAIFNVAIRTIELDKKGNVKIGIGSGIVWDSDPELEYKETILKFRFLTSPMKEFVIFETLKLVKGNLVDLDLHLERLQKSAQYFLFKFDEKKLLNKVQKFLSNIESYEKKRVRIELNKVGHTKIRVGDFPSKIKEVKVIISEKRTDSNNTFQYFKTTNREIYNEEHCYYHKQGFFDVIFLNEKSHLVEGAITNIFIRKGGNWLTPPVDAGLLAGIERKKWLSEDMNVTECNLIIDDILSADEIVLTNSLRGRVRVDKVYINNKEFREF
jgi:para-aminobenzoate synthetase/4-amino-4-deoxychorismate lyase